MNLSLNSLYTYSRSFTFSTESIHLSLLLKPCAAYAHWDLGCLLAVWEAVTLLSNCCSLSLCYWERKFSNLWGCMRVSLWSTRLYLLCLKLVSFSLHMLSGWIDHRSVYKSKCHFSCENCPFKEGVCTIYCYCRKEKKGVVSSLQYVWN